MKIRIDRDGCIECGVCESLCPVAFVLKPDEKASIVEKYQSGSPAEGEVSNDLDSCVKEAEDSCPVCVIKTEP